MFQLNQGEEEEASSFVPLPNARNREGGPIRWSLRYLRESAGEEGGMVIGGGGFGETNTDRKVVMCDFVFVSSAIMILYGGASCCRKQGRMLERTLLLRKKCVPLYFQVISPRKKGVQF